MNKEQKKELLKSKIKKMKQRLKDAEIIIDTIQLNSNPVFLYTGKTVYNEKYKRNK